MIIMTPPHRVKGTAKRLRTILQERGIDIRHVECLDLAARLYGFDNWRHYLDRDLDELLSPLDENLSEGDFAARDEFQMNVMATAGLGPIARELLDRANPTGSWAKKVAAPAEA
jgi:hypothetical protein